MRLEVFTPAGKRPHHDKGNVRASGLRKATGLFELAGLPKEDALHARDDP
jgi:hypothetical protein